MSIRIDFGHGGHGPLLHRSPRLQPAIQLLIQAAAYALDLNTVVEEFAIDAGTLYQVGVFPVDLLWLNRRGYTAHNSDGTIFLTTSGIRFFSLELPIPSEPAPVDVSQPKWYTQRRELLWGSHLIKRFRTPAPNQELILVSFEEEGWPDRIDDPLPRLPSIEPKRRLNDTIATLNRHQQTPKIRFAGDGTGTGIRWERG